MFKKELKSIQQKSFWQQEDVISWILKSILSLLQSLSEPSNLELLDSIIKQQERYYSSLNNDLFKYKDINLEDFLPEFPRFPNDLNPIAPQLMDPRILEAGAGMRFDLHLLEEQLNINNNGNNDINVFDARHNRDNRYFLDLRMPLMDLFIASIFPWYNVRSSL